jgi:nucleotide-binding universal stress UspA family protein
MTSSNPGRAADRPVVFVATDLSSHADEALRQGHLRAEARGAQLVVCHVVPAQVGVNMLFPQRSASQSEAQLSLVQRAEALVVERTTAVTGRDPEQFAVVVRDGTAYSTIIEQAEQASAELIVIGHRGGAGLARMLLGSVAERVVRYAHCAVLIARTSGPTRHIVVATDLSDPSLPALAAAAAESLRAGCPVTALHCIESPVSVAGPEHGMAMAATLPREVLDEVRRHAQKGLADAVAQVGLTGDQRILEGSPVVDIIETAKTLDADLVVIGTRGRTGLSRVVLGSVAEAVVRDAPCSVLAVRLASERTR